MAAESGTDQPSERLTGGNVCVGRYVSVKMKSHKQQPRVSLGPEIFWVLVLATVVFFRIIQPDYPYVYRFMDLYAWPYAGTFCIIGGVVCRVRWTQLNPLQKLEAVLLGVTGLVLIVCAPAIN